jgi:hypothetical protein
LRSAHVVPASPPASASSSLARSVPSRLEGFGGAKVPDAQGSA